MSWCNSILCKDGTLQPVQCGLITKQGDDIVGLPLTHVAASVNITNVLAEITLCQTYVNNTDATVNTMYFFPLAENSALHHFSADKDGILLTGELKLKGEARQEFSEAVAQGKTAFLLEEIKPDILELYVGNLKPGSTCVVTLKYLTELLTESPKSRFTLPTYIAPRYIPASDTGTKIEQVNQQGVVEAPIQISIACSMRCSIREVSSPSHHLETELNNELNEAGFYTSSSSLAGTVCAMDQDFVLLVSCEDPFKPIAIVEELLSDSGPPSYAAMVSMVPQFSTDEVQCELIFVVDCSGSMRGGDRGPMAKAREALTIFIQSLPADCYFNIVRFGSSFESLFPKSQQYDDATLEQAKKYCDGSNMQANLGGTEILNPLNEYLSHPLIEGYSRQVFILTDGEVSNEAQVMELVKTRVEDPKLTARVFSLGIGRCASRSLVRGVARCGNGTALFCTESEGMSEKVITLLSNSVKARITVGKVQYSPDVEAGLSAPDVPYFIYQGYKLLLLNIMGSKPSSLTITTNTPAGIVDIFINDFVFLTDRDVVHKLAARKVIQAAEERGDRDETILEGLALRHKILTKYTSFVCVEEGVECRAELLDRESDSDTYSEDMCMNMQFSGFADSYDGSGSRVFRSNPKKSISFLPKFSNPFASIFKAKKSAKEMSKVLMRDSNVSKSMSRRSTEDAHALDISFEGMACSSAMDSGSVSDATLSGTSGSEAICSSPVRSKEVQKKVQQKDILIELLSLADSKGCFSSGEDVARVTGVSFEDIKDTRGLGTVWYTMLVIVYLSVKLASKKKIWEMAYKKSEKWLKENTDDKDFIEIRKWVSEVLDSL